MVPDFRARLRSGQFQLASWLTILDPAATELMAGSGFDLLIADGEHGPIATADLVQMLIATRAAGVPILYRVAANEPVRIMHALDAGASGVVVPQIRTVADTQKAVAWTRYPPAGLRGIAPRRASEYGRHTAGYLGTANDLVTCCIQIETREALDDLDALGHTGDIGHAEVEDAIGHVLERAREHAVPVGIWTLSAAQVRARREQGFAWATVGADYGFMLAAAEAAARESRQT